MSRLARHIRFLLQRHDMVAVPGIGCFSSLYIPAFYDETTRIFYPYSRNYLYTPEYKGDGSLIMNSYGRQLRMPSAEAREELRRDVDEIKESLQENRKHRLRELGTLYLDDDDKICFKYDIGFDSDAPYRFLSPIGSTSSSLEPMGYDSMTGAVEQVIKKRPGYYYLAINKNFARIAASFLLVLVVGLVALLVPSSGIQAPQAASIVPVESSLTKIHSSENAAQGVSVTEAEHLEALTLEPAQEVDKYFLIVGSFRSLEEARNFMTHYEAKGFDLKLHEGKKINRVSIESADNAQKLYGSMKADYIRKNFPDSWVWENPE